MPPESQQGRRWPAPLVHRLAATTDVRQIAQAILAIWRDVDQALQPIIGHLGVAALYHRSVKLTTASHPWLADAQSDLLAAIDLSTLEAALLQQSAEQAAAGGAALFETFRGLLASLVGDSLTERLLRSVWTPSSGASPAQDHKS